MSAPEKIKDLVVKFRRNIDQYKSPSYNETETRIEFLNPFWKELGWDVDNEAGYALNYRDVIHEDAIKLRNSSDKNKKAPDYSFRIGGVRKFFLEAKKPSVSIKTDIAPAYQLRCYAWSCNLPLSVLSDFEEFAVYNCRVRPYANDSPREARIKYITYNEYIDRWDEIAEIFHRESILRGSFDRFLESNKSKAGTSEVDDVFLAEMEEWRKLLANDMARQNPTLDVRDLNRMVQLTMNRILFLRMAEDRGIEPEEQLLDLIKADNIYGGLLNIYHSADQKYNSGFFHFLQMPDDADAPDTLSHQLSISDRVLKEILKQLYPPKSPYQFDVFPVEILGNVYERFLGSEIRLTEKRMAKVEEKPEVKKAGGVFYTPGYIVDYIVQNTVGKWCEGKTPREVSALKILDPACGSGSFLLGAYKFLLDWHLKWYIWEATRLASQQGVNLSHSTPLGEYVSSPHSDARRVASQKGGKKSIQNQPPIIQTSSGGWALTLAEKKRILLNNIYGVDLDAQAVEVAKLSLSLAVLEGATNEQLEGNLRLFFDRALPNLSSNIKCGNSLISSDFYDDNPLDDFTVDEQLRINAFDWSDPTYGFGDILTAGGFDIVIGNPPYSYMIDDKSQNYFQKTYKHQNYQKDLYLLFLEKYHHLLKKSGALGVIVPNTWLSSLTYQAIRKHLSSAYTWKRFLYLPEYVFKAVVDTIVLIFEKGENTQEYAFDVDVYRKKENSLSLLHTLNSSDIPTDGTPINIISNPKKQALYNRIVATCSQLNTLCKICNGVKPFEKGKGTPPQTEKTMHEKPFVKEGEKPDENWSPLMRGSLIQRYMNLWKNNYWILYGPWLAAPRNSEIFDAPEKIVVRQTGDSLIATIIEGGIIARDNLHIILNQAVYNLLYYLGLINSRFMNFIYEIMNPEKGEALAQVKKKHVELLPIRTIDFSNSSDVAQHDALAKKVEELISLHAQIRVLPMGREQELLARRASTLDRQIDTLVYTLYGLTPEEIALIES